MLRVHFKQSKEILKKNRNLRCTLCDLKSGSFSWLEMELVIKLQIWNLEFDCRGMKSSYNMHSCLCN